MNTREEQSGCRDFDDAPEHIPRFLYFVWSQISTSSRPDWKAEKCEEIVKDNLPSIGVPPDDPPPHGRQDQMNKDQRSEGKPKGGGLIDRAAVEFTREPALAELFVSESWEQIKREYARQHYYADARRQDLDLAIHEDGQCKINERV